MGRVSLYLYPSLASGSLLGLNPHWEVSLQKAELRGPWKGHGLASKPGQSATYRTGEESNPDCSALVLPGRAGTQVQWPSSRSISLRSTSFSLGFPVPWARETSSASSFSQSEKDTGRTPEADAKMGLSPPLSPLGSSCQGVKFQRQATLPTLSLQL